MRLYRARRSRGFDIVDAQRVLVEELAAVIRRHAFQDAFDGVPGARVVGGHVREIRLPHQVVDADFFAELDAFGFEPEVDIHLGT